MFKGTNAITPDMLLLDFFETFIWMSMVEDVMMLVRMMYRLILNHNCDQMEFNSHLMLLGKFLLI